MALRESDLYWPVKRWLEANGYVVHVEIFDADIVAVRDNKITAVELKVAFTTALEAQLCVRATWADYVFAAVPGRQGSFRKKNFRGGFMPLTGFGCLLVDGEEVYEWFKPQPQPWGWHRRHAYRMKRLNGRKPAQDHELAGLPSCRELRAQRLARESVSAT